MSRRADNANHADPFVGITAPGYPMRWQEVSSWSLVDEPGDMVGFGQFYQRYGRMHLARLAVSPERRGQGVGRALVDAIMRVAAEDLGLDDYGLYVYTDNDAAIRCYRAAGFRQARLPEGEVLGGRAIYMTRRRA